MLLKLRQIVGKKGEAACFRCALEKMIIVCCGAVSLFALGACNGVKIDSVSGRHGKPVLIVTTDIGGDPDDMQSLRRLLLYANELEIRGLIASASGTPREVKEGGTRPDLILEILKDYESVRSNLASHADGYPLAGDLREVVAAGSAVRSVDSIVPGAFSEGSRLIEAVVDEMDSPVNIAIWGGARDLAQALCDVRAERSEDELKRFVEKLRVYTIGDQDGYNSIVDGVRQDLAGTGKWIKDNFPQIFYLETNPPDRNRFASLFRGMYQNDSVGGTFPRTPLVKPGIERLNQESWLREHVLLGHGPLGAGYPLTSQNPRSERNTRGVKEGDTPSWFYFLPNGLSSIDNPTWGGWGGRFEKAKRNHYVDTRDRHWIADADDATRVKWTVARWREAYQNDFAARMDWCVAAREAANHSPSITVNDDATLGTVYLDARSEMPTQLEITCVDEDGDAVVLDAWVYGEVTGVESSDLKIGILDSGDIEIIPGSVAAGNVYHVILQCRDSGIPALTCYRRIVLDVH